MKKNLQKNKCLCLFIILLLSFNICLTINAEEAAEEVFIMAGQSNMGEMGRVKNLRGEFKKEVGTTKLFNFKSNKWVRLADYYNNNETFGIELGLAIELNTSSYLKNKETNIIRFHKNGSFINQWLPETKDSFLKELKNKIQIAKNNPKNKFKVIGFVWMLGETDSTSEKEANKYAENFLKVVNFIKEISTNDDFPVFIGLSFIKNKKGNEMYKALNVVREQQKTFLNQKNYYLIETNDLSRYPDGIHLDSGGQLEFGKRIGKEYLKFISKNNKK